MNGITDSMALRKRIHEILAQSGLPNDIKGGVLIGAARDLDMACAIFTPEEIGDCDVSGLEDRMVSAGNDYITMNRTDEDDEA